MTNILKAICNFSKSEITEIGSHYKNVIRIQQVGDSLEYFIKDLLADTLNSSEEDRNKEYEKCFSYLGGTNNPPDLIIKQGDAFEIKKIENLGGTIALNSSFPKQKLFCNDAFISNECKNCEPWTEKDIVYAIGSIERETNKILSLWMVYGDCYCAGRSHYENIKKIISDGIDKIDGMEFSETKELGRVNKIDPLQITYLRIRGMWGIKHPTEIFNQTLTMVDKNILNVVMLKTKFDSFPSEDKENIRRDEKITVKEVKIKDPDSPTKDLDAIYISIKKQD